MSTDVTGPPHDTPRYQFDEFVLDVADRQLWRGGTRIDLNARYLDALVVLVRESGRLVEKERLFDEVWHDVVVSDSALTQCIKEIRKQLGDDATNPRYVQTVPRHGYRFIGDAKPVAIERAVSAQPPDPVTSAGRTIWQDGLFEWGAGTLGGGVAGIIGGLFYGYALASSDGGVGTLSTLLVLVSLCALVGLTGGLGVSLGLAAAGMMARSRPGMRVGIRIAGAVLGGLFIGSLAKLLGVDAFNLLTGRAPAGITGGPEGAVLGGAVAVGAYLGNRMGGRVGRTAWWIPVAGAAVGGALAGTLIPIAGGNLMGGSLDLLAKSFAESRIELDRLGLLFGELDFGAATQAVLGGFEGLLFGGCVVGALALAARFKEGPTDPWKL